MAVCIATYRRPAGLKALLESLDGLTFPGAAPELRLIVVDNAPDAPASAALGALDALSRWPVTSVVESRRGVVAARNRALSLVPQDMDFIAFLDDDEVVTPGWLAAMLQTRRSTGAEAVQGPVRPVYEAPPPAWLEATGLFGLGPFDEGQPLGFAATNNSLVAWPFVQRHGLSFDPRFNLTGGEDEEFFTRLRQAGGRIVASRDALVLDHVPANRMRLGWVLRRVHRMGNTLGRIALLHRRGRAMRLAKGLAATALGAGQALLPGLFSARHRVRGLMEVARGAGMLAAFLRLSVDEYSNEAVANDRTEHS